MKRIVFTLSLTTILFTVFSCRENRPKAKMPAHTNQMEGVDESQMKKDSISKKRQYSELNAGWRQKLTNYRTTA